MTVRVIIFVSDGLRPDRIDPVRTPNLWRLREGATWYRRARTVFPSETRVAAASLVTGVHPGEHGIVANDFYDRAVFADRPVATASAQDLAVVSARRGRLLARQTLAERAPAVGKRYAVVSTASQGTSRILMEGARHGGAFGWTVHRGLCQPADTNEAVVRKFGAQPADTIPRSALIDYAARVLTEFVLPDLKPDIAIFWSGEPDSTYHYRGVGSPEAAQAEAAADAALGRLLAWRDRVGDGEDFQIIVASDHGHITGTDRTDTVAALRAGGFNAVESSPDMSDILCIPGGTAQIYRLGQDARADRALSDWLSEQPWCAGVIAPEPTNAETVGFAALGIARTEHLRLLAIMKSSDTTDMFGVPGVCHFDADLPVGGGMHGGLHRLELANVLILSGSAFRVEAAVDTPAGLIDVAPTVARLVGLDGGDFSGRVLVEALAGHRLGGVEPVAQGAFRLTHGRRALAWSGVGGQRYLDGLVAS